MKGFVTIALKKSSLFADIFPTDSHPDVFITVRDGNDVMYTSEDELDSAGDMEKLNYTERKTIEISGRQWVLEVMSKPSFSDSYSEKGLPAVVGVGGITLSLLLFLIFYYSGKRANQLIKLQSAALNAAANGVVLTDNKGIIQWVNPAFTRLTGYEVHEVIGQSIKLLKSDKQDEEFYKSLWDTILSGKVWKGEITNKRKDGSLYQEEELISPVTDTRGNITHFIAIKQDISQRKKLEEKTASMNSDLEESKKAMMNVLEDLNTERKKLEQEAIKDNAILSSIGEGLIVTDQAGKILLVNDAFEGLLGWKRPEVVGKNMLDVVQKYDDKDELIPREKRSLTKVLDGDTKKSSISTITTTHCYLRRDKTKLPIIGVVTPIILDDEIIGAVQVFRDISKEKEIDTMKDEFVSIASHELRTPLTAIDGLVSMVLDGEYGPVNDGLKQPLNDISSSSDRLIHLVNDLLSLSRIQAGRLKYGISEFELSRVVQDVSNLLQPILKNKGIELRMGTHEEMTVQADSDKVKQVVNNLIGNALKFTDAGEIVVSLKINKDVAEIAIADTGIGISKEDQPKLFGKFQQLETAQGRPPGTGLGLHISREMARKMGGDVWLASSEVGKGSTFVFSVPIVGTDRAKKAQREIKQEAKTYADKKEN